MLQVFISGVDRTDMLTPGSFKLPDRVNERSEASFTLKLPAGGTWHPLPFDTVTVRLDGVLIFSGFVWDDEEERIALLPGFMPMLAPVRCVDLHMLADRRLVAETYDGQTTGAIFRDLINKYLSPEGVTAGTVQDGPVLTRAVFNYQDLSRCFDEIAELAGFVWQITPDRVASFFDRTTNRAPWAIDATAPLRSLKVRRHREKYRNRQIMRAGTATTDPRTDRFKGDGTAKVFTCAFPLATVPTIKVNGTAVAPDTIGIKGLQQGKLWYWQKDDPVIAKDNAGAAPSATDTIEVTYQGLYPLVIESTNRNEVATRSNAEGGSGIYEEVEQNANLDNQDAAREYADGRLRQFARINGEVIFTTQKPGIKAGQLITVNLPEHDFYGDFLVSEVTLSDGGIGEYGTFEYSVRAADGSSVGGWIYFFKRLAEAGKQYAIRENEVVVKLNGATSGIGIGVTMSIFKGAPSNTVGFAEVGFSQVGG